MESLKTDLTTANNSEPVDHDKVRRIEDEISECEDKGVSKKRKVSYGGALPFIYLSRGHWDTTTNFRFFWCKLSEGQRFSLYKGNFEIYKGK